MPLLSTGLVNRAAETPEATPKGPSNIKVGGIPLPAFIVLIMFAPFFLSFIGFVLYHYTVQKPRDRKMLADEARIEAGKQEAELQLQRLVVQKEAEPKVPPAARTREGEPARLEVSTPGYRIDLNPN